MTEIRDGKVVSIAFVLRDSKGKELDRSEEGRALAYLHGARNIVPGLEAALAGKKVGDHVEVEVPPERGYGETRRVKAKRMLRSKFPAGARIQKGTSFLIQGPDGRRFPIWVTKVMGREVHVSPEHPLSGVTLRFEVDVLDIRDATEDEIEHGHPHGPGGVEHDDEPGADDATDASREEAGEEE